MPPSRRGWTHLRAAHEPASSVVLPPWVGLVHLLTAEIALARIDDTLPDFVALGAILAVHATRESQDLAVS